MKLKLCLVGLLLGAATSTAAERPAREPLTLLNFATESIRFYVNDNGKPGSTSKKLSRAVIVPEKGELLAWDETSKTMLINFGQGDTGWVKKADLVPKAEVCRGVDQSRPVPRPSYTENSQNRRAVTRGLAEKACK